MTLYHTTIQENLAAIEFDGLVPSGDTSAYGYEREDNTRGVYGFATIEDARNFAIDNGWYEAAIVSFDTDEALEVVNDPEYDEGTSYIVVPTSSTICAELVEIME